MQLFSMFIKCFTPSIGKWDGYQSAVGWLLYTCTWNTHFILPMVLSNFKPGWVFFCVFSNPKTLVSCKYDRSYLHKAHWGQWRSPRRWTPGTDGCWTRPCVADPEIPVSSLDPTPDCNTGQSELVADTFIGLCKYLGIVH